MVSKYSSNDDYTSCNLHINNSVIDLLVNIFDHHILHLNICALSCSCNTPLLCHEWLVIYSRKCYCKIILNSNDSVGKERSVRQAIAQGWCIFLSG